MRGLAFYDTLIHRVESLAFGDLPKLIYLKLSGVKNLTMQSLSSLDQLQILEVEFQTSARIYIDHGAIFNLTQLQQLYVYNDSTTTLNLDIFSHGNLMSLSTLTMKLCSYETIRMSNTNWTVFKNLKTLFLGQGQLKKLDSFFFKGLSSIEKLSLTSNTVNELEPDVWHDLINLKELNLNHNRLTTLPRGAFAKLKSLEVLNLANNFITHLSPSLWPSRVVQIVLHGNDIVELGPLAFDSLYFLRRVELQKNTKLKLLRASCLNNLRLMDFVLSNTNIEKLEPNSFTNTTIDMMNLNANTRIKTLDGYFFGLRKQIFYFNIKQIQMNDWIVRNIDGTIWQYFANLESLSLERNHLDGLTEGQFSNLNYLKFLNLHDNDITKISNCTFCGLSNLTVLNITNNPLEETLSRNLYDGLLNSNLTIATDNGTLNGPMGNCSANCYKSPLTTNQYTTNERMSTQLTVTAETVPANILTTNSLTTNNQKTSNLPTMSSSIFSQPTDTSKTSTKNLISSTSVERTTQRTQTYLTTTNTITAKTSPNTTTHYFTANISTSESSNIFSTVKNSKATKFTQTLSTSTDVPLSTVKNESRWTTRCTTVDGVTHGLQNTQTITYIALVTIGSIIAVIVLVVVTVILVKKHRNKALLLSNHIRLADIQYNRM